MDRPTNRSSASLIPTICLLMGCTASSRLPLLPEDGANSYGIELVRLSSHDGVSNYLMTNRGTTSLHYLHWMGQGPEPVVYCLNQDGSERICSKKVYVIGGKETGFDEWVHDTYLPPQESARITANVSSSKRIGVRVFTDDPMGEKIVWFVNQ